MLHNHALDALRYHVSGAVERGEKEPIQGIPAVSVRDEYAPRFGRQVLTVWSGAFASEFIGTATELPHHDGYMVRLPYVDESVRVICESPRTDDNYQAVDSAIVIALTERAA